MSLTPRSDFQDELPDVPVKGTKAIVGAVIAAVSLVATGLLDLVPDPTVALVCKIIVLVAGSLGTAFGIYQTTNKPV